MNNYPTTENEEREYRISHLQEMIAMAEHALILNSHAESSILCSIAFGTVTEEKQNDLCKTRADKEILRNTLNRSKSELLKTLIPA